MKGITVKKILSLSCLSLMITACTQTNPATIEDISDSSSNSGSTVYAEPPANISTGDRDSATIIDGNPSSSSAPVPVNSSNNSTVTTTNERIVYNRNYDDIPKGGYKGDTYTVKRGDTLFYIAYITGNDYRSLAAKNNIKEPYAVNPGQVLDVGGGTTVVVTKKTTTNNSGIVKNNDYGSTSQSSAGQNKNTSLSTTTTITTTTTSGNSKLPKTTQSTETVSVSDINQVKSGNSATVGNISWQWPAKGKIIEKFSQASKGIDISGSLGEKVVAAADGRVVYSGNALPGYGNLIIVKHNDDYLTAYAHNQSILVKEQQTVRAGEQIATMGATGTSSVRLHFEIRYKAQSVDPIKYLPN